MNFDNVVQELLSHYTSKTIVSERIYYHGSTKNALDQVLADGKLKSNALGSKKVSMGLTSEKDFIYLTPSMNIARQYAKGYEANMYAHRDEKFDFGGIVEVDLPDDIRLIDFNTPLSDEQLEIVNSFLPHYKPIKKGEDLSRFPWRSNHPERLGEVVRKLGFDGYIQDGNQIAVLDEVPIRAVYDADNRRIF